MLFREEYLRKLKSKATFVIIWGVAISVASYFLSLSEKNLFIEQLASPGVDQNIEALKRVIGSYSGYKFLFQYWFGDLSVIETLGFFLWIGIFLSSDMYTMRVGGLGNSIVVRKGYRKYSRCILSAQSLYILTIVAVTSVLQFIVACCIGGWSFENQSIGKISLSLLGFFLVSFGRIIIVTVYYCLLNIIASDLEIILQNRFVIQCGLLIFSTIILLAAVSIGNIVPSFGTIFERFMPTNINYSLDTALNNPNSRAITLEFVPIIFYALCAVIFETIKNKKFSFDYL